MPPNKAQPNLTLIFSQEVVSRVMSKGFDSNLVMSDTLTAVENEKIVRVWEIHPSALVPLASKVVLSDSQTLHRVLYIDSETFITYALRTAFMSYEPVDMEDNDIIRKWNDLVRNVWARAALRSRSSGRSASLFHGGS
jgi:hypothetical protein